MALDFPHYRPRALPRWQPNLVAPPATAQPDGSLTVARPNAATRYPFGNCRLFAEVDGTGALRKFSLAEGVRVLARWEHAAPPALDDVPLAWDSAAASGRTFVLEAERGAAHVTLTTAADEGSAAVVQEWRVENHGGASVTLEVALRAGFDLCRPVFKLHARSAVGAARALLQSRAARAVLGPRRWALDNRIGSWAKQPAPVHFAPLYPHAGGLAARDSGGAAFLLADPAPVEADPASGLLRLRLAVAPGATETLVLAVTATSQSPISNRQAPGPEPARALVARVLAGAANYDVWLRTTCTHSDPLLRSLALAGLNTALAMYKELPSGFAGLWAGQGYAYPPRTYFRDGYWTALPLLPFRPEWARRHVLTLARAVGADGACPSAIFDPAILSPGARAEDVQWLPGHHDSPAYFVLLVADLLRATGDAALLDEQVRGRSIWEAVAACTDYLRALDTDGDGLPEKPRAPNDWADNVLRSQWVTYDVALAYGALRAAAALAESRGDARGDAWRAAADKMRRAAHEHLWDAEHGYFVDYRRPGFSEDHLALDSFLAIRLGLATEEQAGRMVEAARHLLQSRNNRAQPWGDWGVLCCFPPYRLRADLFGKSADPFRYHNGAEWPYLSAIYAEILLERGDADWRYVLTRWWQRSLGQGRLVPVEFVSPGYPPGAFLNGWSGLAARVVHLLEGT